MFLPPGGFCYSEDNKGTVAQDFLPRFFHESTLYENILGYESGIRSIHEKKRR
jgi:hypothetical protein